MKVFLGGTCTSNWRDILIPMLTIDYFNPIVDDWNEEAQENELRERETCDFVLYVITSSFEGVYSIAEVVDDSNKRPEKTIFCILNEKSKPFSKQQVKSMKMVKNMVKNNGAKVFDDLTEIADFLNGQN